MSFVRDKDGARTNRIQARGDNWNKFEEYARQRESVGEGNFPNTTRNPLSPTSGRLHKEDMAIYGREPATDKMILVVCDICQRVVKSQAFMKHKEFCHPEATKGPLLQRVPVQTMGQPSTMLEGVANGSEGKRKAFDIDRQCGVWMDKERKYCKKSISCKIHSLEQRRKVTGRSRPLSELISEYKKLKKIKRIAKTAAGQPNTVPLMSPSHVPANHTLLSPVSPFTPLSPKLETPYTIRRDSPPHSSIMCYFDDIEVDKEEEEKESLHEHIVESVPSISPSLSDDQLYPKPAAVCLFGRRVTTGRGCFSLFNHKLDTLRSSLVSLSGRERDFNDVINIPDSSTKRKYSSNLNHKQKRKYAQIGDQNHVLLAKLNTSLSIQQPVSSSSSHRSQVTPTSTAATIKTSSFYSSKNTKQHNTSTSCINTTQPLSVTNRPHQLLPSAATAFNQTSFFQQSTVLDRSKLQSPVADVPYPVHVLNHVIEGCTTPSFMNNNAKLECINSNHVDQWTEENSFNNTLQNFQSMKIPTPTINGVINSPNSLGGGIVQPFSLNSQQTYLINPSQQQPHHFSGGLVPIGLGVSHTPSSTSFPPQSLPVLYPGDKPDQGLIQLMTQTRVPMQQPHPQQPHPQHPTTLTSLGDNDRDMSQYSREQVMLGSNSIGFNQHKFAGGIHSKQFDNMQQPIPFNDNYVGEFGINLTNQCVNPPNQYGDFANQFGNRPSPGNFPHHSLHQMTTGGLVQSSNELPSHALPPNPPIPHPSQSTNPSVHCISPSGKPNNYLHSSQTGIVSPQSTAHRTQRVS